MIITSFTELSQIAPASRGLKRHAELAAGDLFFERFDIRFCSKRKL